MIAEEVLDLLAKQQDSLNFLANDGRQRLVDARLSVFRSDEHFAVFSEFPHFQSYEGFTNWLGFAGNCLVHDVYKATFGDWNLLEDVPDAPFHNTDSGQWFLDLAQFSVRVKGRRFDFAPSPKDYERAGIESRHNGRNALNAGELMRFVSVALDHPFYLSEEERRALIQPLIEPQISLLLQTSYWQHPVWIDRGGDEDDWIENIPCWQILARAIASGNLDEWNAQDTSGFNTDWASLERIRHDNGPDGLYGFG